MEIIIVDDCSGDRTVQEIENFIASYEWWIPIKLIKNIINAWPGKTYNRAVECAMGRYITFVDSDDFLIAPWFAEKIHLFEQNNFLKIVYANGYFFEDNSIGRMIQSHLPRLLSWSIDHIRARLFENIPMLSISCSVIRRDFFLEIWWFDNRCQSNDWVLNIRIMNSISSREAIGYVLDPVFAYRMHSANISKNQERMITLLVEVVENYFPWKYKMQGYSNIFFTASLNYLTQGECKKSCKAIKKSLQSQFSLAHLIIYILVYVSPVAWLSHKFPQIFNWCKKFIQHITSHY